MPLYHGASAGAALAMLMSNKIRPSKDGFFYCFNSNEPESMAGALCFATGEKLRPGVIDPKNLLKRYCDLNPGFPTGLKGAFIRVALRASVLAWTNGQHVLAMPPYDDRAAIIVFEDHLATIDVCRGGFINEARIPAAALSSLRVQRLYIDDSILNIPVVEDLRKGGIIVSPLSEWEQMVWSSPAASNQAKNHPQP